MLKAVAVAVAVATLAAPTTHQAGAAPASLPASATDRRLAASVSRQPVNDTLRALAVLHDYGYVIDTPARAERAIRHWQRVNGLVIDGIVGPRTLNSLHLATAVAPAVRVNPPTPPPCDVECIVRDVWPDDLEDWALRIVKRESNFVPTAHNSCCHGLFQIHFQAHRAWLGQFGVTKPSDLWDPTVNATVALALYRAAGPGPWAL